MTVCYNISPCGGVASALAVRRGVLGGALPCNPDPIRRFDVRDELSTTSGVVPPSGGKKTYRVSMGSF